MAGQVGAPVSAVLQLQATVSADDLTASLAGWLSATHAVALRTAEYTGLMIEWQVADDAPFACRLVASDSGDQARRTVTVVCDEIGAVAIVDESPFAVADAPHSSVDLSAPIRALLASLLPFADTVQGLVRGIVNDLAATDSEALLVDLCAELAPGLVLAITAPDAAPTTAQTGLLENLHGLALAGVAPVGSALISAVGLSSAPRAGSVVCLSRGLTGLDAEVITSMSLRTKLDSARRLIVRRQLAAPVPFGLERRRAAAMSRLLSGGTEIDLPTALQLLDEESQRANEFSNRVKELERLLDGAYEEQDSALGELDNAQSQVRYLQKAFKELGEVPIVETEDDDDWLPEFSVDALVAARESLPYLVFGATDDRCGALDAQQKRGIWAKKIWSSLRALNDYCRAKAEGRFSGDIAMYRDNPPDGAIPLLAEYAPTESKSTSDDAGLVAVRTFTVPVAIHPSGKTYMQQHVKIDKGGQSAPRIHLHDGSDNTQRIYIGYIGPHLPTAGGF